MTGEQMRAGVGATRCTACGAVYFPHRLLCARCHGAAFTEQRLDTARVEEITTIRHVLGQSDWQPRRLANVTAPEGLSFTIGLLDAAREGDVVELLEEGTAPFGRLKQEGTS